VPAFAPYLLLVLVSTLPRVEDPIPETIGFGSIVFAAGAGGVWGFWIGLLLYLLALFVQVGFGL